jgi:CubicO group peptidase (beta-lactamase class C family)
MSLGLLGHLLSRKLEKPYEQALIDMVLSPLEMNDTRITLSEEQKKRLAPGHDADLMPTNPWTTSALDGAFALRSSMHDLIIFAKANIGLIETPLSPAMQAAHQEQFKKSSVESVGLGWNANSNGVLFHSGATGGYRSAVYIIPKSKLAIIVLSNTLVGGTTDARAGLFEILVVNVLQLVAGVPLLPLEFPKVGSSKRDIKEYIGQYGAKLNEANNLRVLLSAKGELQAIPPGKIANRLYPMSEDVFFMKSFDVSVQFIPGKDGKIESVEATIDGAKRTMQRLD